MYCKKCGHNIEEGSGFCGGCGVPLTTANTNVLIEEKTNGAEEQKVSLFGASNADNAVSVPPPKTVEQPAGFKGMAELKQKQKNKKSKLLITITIVLVLVIGASAAAIFGVSALNTKKYNELIDTGNKYLVELKYEEAVETYLEAIDIKPKREEAYVGAATGYTGLGELEKARDILEKGLENVKEPSENFTDLCDELGVEYDGSGESKLTVLSETATDSATQTTAADTTATTQTTTMPETTARSLSESELKAVLSKKTKGTIVYFAYDDFDGDSKKEAFALVGKIVDYYIDADVWFVNSSGAVNLYPATSVDKDSFEIWDLGQQKIFKFEQQGGSDSVSHAWFVNNNKAVKIKNTGQNLIYSSGKNFSTAVGEFDAYFDSESDYGTGHTWKRYYLYWDGFGFKEYGGIAISKAQLLQLRGAQEIINSIEQTGAVVTNIFYRGNDIININYTKNYDGGYSADNATLKRSGNTVELVSSNQGIYKAAMTPSIAVYPSKFP